MPGFFGDQANRLTRQDWGHPSANALAEELAAMFAANVPMTTDQPIVVTRTNPDGSAVTIIDQTDGTTAPIKVTGGDGSTEALDPGGFKCCGGGGGGGGPGGGGKPGDKTKKPADPPGGGNVTPAPAPVADPPSKRLFQGNVRIQLHDPGNPYGWDGEEPVFTGKECRQYNPPTIPAPSSAFGFAEINDQIIAFIARNGLSGSYTVISDVVSPPGPECTA